MTFKGEDMATKKKRKHVVYVRWGENEQRERYDSPRDANRYEFDSKKELDAFLLAIDEHDGWLGCDVFTPKELAQQPEAWE